MIKSPLLVTGPSSAKVASPAPFLNSAGGRRRRTKPQLEDDASATDLRKEEEEQGLD